MKKKGQIGVGSIIVVAVLLIVGLILFQTVAQQVGTVTNTVTLTNESFTAPAAEGTYDFTSYRAINDVVIYNGTGVLVPAANYTITNNVVSNGALVTRLTVGAVNAYAEQTWNISGTAQPLTYETSSGGRSVMTLVVVFFALMVAALAISPVGQSKILEMLGK